MSSVQVYLSTTSSNKYLDSAKRLPAIHLQVGLCLILMVVSNALRRLLRLVNVRSPSPPIPIL